ncbi:MAG TPA: transglutaminase family protein [Stellaceae bacterium]|nr:transglutaminase family protein [Stellaceae bacterium]
MAILKVDHKTVYRYAKPVEFGDHRLMFRPRDSHDLWLLDTALAISPKASVRWLHDVFGNSIAIARFAEPATELRFESSFRAEHFPVEPRELVLEPYAGRYPFRYAAEDVPDLGGTAERHYPDPGYQVANWARWFVEGGRSRDTLDILIGMTRSIKHQFGYARREEAGTQEPSVTLATRSGSCRDFALFMMEAARSLGFAARFVSGYLYDENLIGAQATMIGGGETHAWVQIYLPGAGWVEFDPTNALVGGRNLIRVAVARDPSQAVPLSGTYSGLPGDFLGLSVEVTVTTE